MDIRDVEKHSMKQREECALWDLGSGGGERMQVELSNLNKIVNILLYCSSFSIRAAEASTTFVPLGTYQNDILPLEVSGSSEW